jgi:hypothetical protein
MAAKTEVDNHKAKTAKRPAALPEERFWKKYSKHHELPLSTASSVVLHAIGIAILIGAGIIWARYKANYGKVEVAPLIIAGGGGQRGGIDGPPTGTGQAESIQQDAQATETRPPSEVPKADLKKAEAMQSPVLPKSTPSERLFQENPELSAKLSGVGEAAHKKIGELQGLASKGKGGRGSGGGHGGGVGTGTGDLTGPGVQNLTQRSKRQSRWIMVFNTRDGEDYARQLSGLRAILAFPAPNAKEGWMVIEDIGKRPVEPRPKDVGEIDRIYWVDDKQGSVASLAHALRIDSPPPFFAAFFPVELEKELLEKELKYRNAAEDEIDETRFVVRRSRTGRGYEPYVVEQRRVEDKRRR